MKTRHAAVVLAALCAASAVRWDSSATGQTRPVAQVLATRPAAATTTAPGPATRPLPTTAAGWVTYFYEYPAYSRTSQVDPGMAAVERFRAVSALRALGPAGAEALAVTLPKCREDQVLQAQDALVDLGEPAVPAIARLLAPGSDPTGRLRASQVLARLGSRAQAAQVALIAAVAEPVEAVKPNDYQAQQARMRAVQAKSTSLVALAQLKGPGAPQRAQAFADALASAANAPVGDPSREVTQTAVQGLLMVGPESNAIALKAVTAILDRAAAADPKQFENNASPELIGALRIVWKMGPAAAPAAPSVGKVLRMRRYGGSDYGGSVHRVTAGALAAMGEPGVKELVTSIDLPESWPATALVCDALEALGKSAASATPVLSAKLDGNNSFEVLPKLSALAAIGPDAKAALPAVRAAAAKTNAPVLDDVRRLMVPLVVESLEGKAPPALAPVAGFKATKLTPAQLAADAALLKQIVGGPTATGAGLAEGHGDQLRFQAATLLAATGDYDAARQAMGEYGDWRLEATCLARAAQAKGRAGDNAAAAVLLRRATLRCLRRNAMQPDQFGRWHELETAMAYVRLGVYEPVPGLLTAPDMARELVAAHVSAGRLKEAARAAADIPPSVGEYGSFDQDPKIWTLLELGEAQLAAGDKTGAAASFARGIDESDRQQTVMADRLTRLAMGLVEAGQVDVAIDKLSKFSDFNGDHHQALRDVAARLEGSGNAADAARAKAAIPANAPARGYQPGSLEERVSTLIARGDLKVATAFALNVQDPQGRDWSLRRIAEEQVRRRDYAGASASFVAAPLTWGGQDWEMPVTQTLIGAARAGKPEQAAALLAALKPLQRVRAYRTMAQRRANLGDAVGAGALLDKSFAAIDEAARPQPQAQPRPAGDGRLRNLPRPTTTAPAGTQPARMPAAPQPRRTPAGSQPFPSSAPFAETQPLPSSAPFGDAAALDAGWPASRPFDPEMRGMRQVDQSALLAERVRNLKIRAQIGGGPAVLAEAKRLQGTVPSSQNESALLAALAEVRVIAGDAAGAWADCQAMSPNSRLYVTRAIANALAERVAGPAASPGAARPMQEGILGGF